MTTTAAAGWYPNPNDARVMRYWTGVQWSGERVWTGTAWTDTAPVAATAPTPVPAPVAAAPPQFAAAPAANGYATAPPYPQASLSVPPGYYASPAPVAAVPSSKRPVSQRVRARLLLTLGGAALVVVGVLMPYATQNNGITTSTIHGTDRSGGAVTIVIALVVVVLAGLFINGTIGRRSAIATFLLGGIALAICIGNMSNISDVMDQEKAQSADLISAGGGTKFGAGLFVVLVGCVLVLIGSIMTFVSARRSRAA